MRPERFFDNLETIGRATKRLEDACMTRKGFRPADAAQLVDRIQGEIAPDMAFRRSEGYGFSHYLRPIWQVSDDEAADWYRAFRGNRSDTVEWRTIGGTGATAGGGCVAEARKAVAGSVLDWFWAASAQQDYWLVVAAATANDPRWEPAAALWAQCMADSGYPGLGGPQGAWARARSALFADHENGSAVPPEARSFEIEVATADGDCQTSTGMVDVQREIRSDFLADASPKYLRDLDRIAAAQTAALKTIRSEGLDR